MTTNAGNIPVHAAAELVHDLRPLAAAINPNCFSSFDPECTCCCVALKQKLGAGGWGWGGAGEVSSVHMQSTQPTQIFLSSVIPAARQLACTCLLPAAVTTPSAPNSTITLASATEFRAAVWHDRLANPRDALIREKHHSSDPVTDTGINERECSRSQQAAAL